MVPATQTAPLDEVLALHYLSKSDAGSAVKGSLGLRGAMVSLLAADAAGGRQHCLKLTTPDASMVLQAASENERLNWAAAIAEAVAVANGGGHLLMVSNQRTPCALAYHTDQTHHLLCCVSALLVCRLRRTARPG